MNLPRTNPRKAASTKALGKILGPTLCVAALAVAPTWAAAGRLQPLLVVWGYSDDQSFEQPRGIAFDPLDGAIYIGNTGAHRIEVFSKTGRPLTRFVHRVTGRDGAAVDGRPCALAFDRAGHLVVADQMAPYVDVLDRRGRHITRLEISAGHASALAIASDGTILVGTDAEESKIHRFRRDYTPLDSWGTAGEAPGQLHNVTALAPLADGTLAVACSQTELGVQIFTMEGEYLRGFGTHEMGPGNLSHPSGLLGMADGRIWVLDEIRQSIQVFDKDGAFVEQQGGNGTAPGEFSHPSSIATNGAGWIAVTDRGLGRFQVLSISSAGEVSGTLVQMHGSLSAVLRSESLERF